MNGQINIPDKLYEDEVVCYLASRYHTTAKKIVQCFLVQEDFIHNPEEDSGLFRLEDNEMEIMRGLTTHEGHS